MDEQTLIAIVRRHHDVYREVQARETELRFRFSDEDRQRTPPWTMLGRERFAEEEAELWLALDEGRLQREEALTRMSELMARYYAERQ